MLCAVDWPVTIQLTDTVLDFFAAAAWPAAAAWIAVQFKNPIAAAIGRVRNISALGLQADMATMQQEVPEPPVAAIPDGTATGAVSEEVPFDEVLTHIDQQYLAGLVHLPPERQLRAALRLASTNLQLWRMESLYRLIFGTQLSLLHSLQMGPQSFDSVRTHFETHKATPPPVPSYTFDNWIAWLVQSGLIKYLPESVQPMLTITIQGRRLLEYLALNGIPENKPF